MQTVAMLGVVAVLAATAAPTIERYLNHAKILKAIGEVKVLTSALHLLRNDLGERCIPLSSEDREPLALLVSDGDVPGTGDTAGEEWATPDTDEFVGNVNAYLITNTPLFPPRGGGRLSFGWDGPYLQTPMGPDPWGNRYAVSAAMLTMGRGFVPVVLCAGPDGVVEVPFELQTSQTTSPLGDDIYQSLE